MLTMELKDWSDEYLLQEAARNDALYASVVEKRAAKRFTDIVGNNAPPINPIFLDIRDKIKSEVERRNLKV